ncbi:MAG: helix-turn-helix domain-containing protein [Candidatus Dormiibacterota bacterium]
MSEIRCDEGLSQVFELLGKRWTGMIIAVLLERPARFAELSRAVPGITEGVLSARLTELQAARLVQREVLGGPPVSTVYRLTPSGEGLRAALEALGVWAQRHLTTSPGSSQT